MRQDCTSVLLVLLGGTRDLKLTVPPSLWEKWRYVLVLDWWKLRTTVKILLLFMKEIFFSFFSWSPTDNTVNDCEKKNDFQWYNLSVALLSSILCLSSGAMTKPAYLGMKYGDRQQFCIGITAFERQWESKRFSGSWMNFVGGWQGDTHGCPIKKIWFFHFFRINFSSR